MEEGRNGRQDPRGGVDLPSVPVKQCENLSGQVLPEGECDRVSVGNGSSYQPNNPYTEHETDLINPVSDTCDLSPHRGNTCDPVSDQGNTCDPVSDQGNTCDPESDQGDTCDPETEPGDTCDPISDQGDTCDPESDQGNTCDPESDRGVTCDPVSYQNDTCDPVSSHGDTCDPASNQGNTCNPMPDKGDTCDTVSKQDDTCDPVTGQGDTCDTVSKQGDTCDPVTGQGDTCDTVSKQGDTRYTVSKQGDTCDTVSKQGDTCDTVQDQETLLPEHIYRNTCQTISELENVPPQQQGNARDPLPEEKACATVLSDDDQSSDDEFLWGIPDGEAESTRRTEYRPSRSNLPLMTGLETNEHEAVQRFVDNFRERYDTHLPCVFIGSLIDAIEETFCQTNNKMLAIYLHNDNSIVSNVFATQIMCKCDVISVLCEHFVVWAWDVSSEVNRKRFKSRADLAGLTMGCIPAESCIILVGNVVAESSKLSVLHQMEYDSPENIITKLAIQKAWYDLNQIHWRLPQSGDGTRGFRDVSLQQDSRLDTHSGRFQKSTSKSLTFDYPLNLRCLVSLNLKEEKAITGQTISSAQLGVVVRSDVSDLEANGSESSLGTSKQAAENAGHTEAIEDLIDQMILEVVNTIQAEYSNNSQQLAVGDCSDISTLGEGDIEPSTFTLESDRTDRTDESTKFMEGVTTQSILEGFHLVQDKVSINPPQLAFVDQSGASHLENGERNVNSNDGSTKTMNESIIPKIPEIPKPEAETARTEEASNSEQLLDDGSDS